MSEREANENPPGEWYNFAAEHFENAAVDGNGRLKLRLTADQAANMRWVIGTSLGVPE